MEPEESVASNTLVPTTSAAKRLRRIFEHFNVFSNNKALHAQWAKVFQVSPSDPSQPQLVATEVARQLSLVGRQIDLVERKLQADHPTLSSGTTTNQTHRLRLLLANCLSNLQAPWANLKADLTPDLLKSLEFWDELIVCDEYEISNAGLDEINELLRQAEELANTSKEKDLASVLLQAILSMKRAIRDYAIGGEEEFRRSARDAYATIISNADLIQRNSQSEEVSALAKAWKKFQEVCAPILFADALLTAGGRFKALADPIIRMLGNGS